MKLAMPKMWVWYWSVTSILFMCKMTCFMNVLSTLFILLCLAFQLFNILLSLRAMVPTAHVKKLVRLPP